MVSRVQVRGVDHPGLVDHQQVVARQGEPDPPVLVGLQRCDQPGDVDRLEPQLGQLADRLVRGRARPGGLAQLAQVAGGDLGGRSGDDPSAVLDLPGLGQLGQGVGLPRPGRSDQHLDLPLGTQDRRQRGHLVLREARPARLVGDPPHRLGAETGAVGACAVAASRSSSERWSVVT